MLPENREPIAEANEEEEKDDMFDEVAEVIGGNAGGLKQGTSIVYSDKSESSIESNMEDTPSNYNILNGRLDEQSRGLRGTNNTMTKANRIIAAFKSGAGSPRRTRGFLDTIHEAETDKKVESPRGKGIKAPEALGHLRPKYNPEEH